MNGSDMNDNYGAQGAQTQGGQPYGAPPQGATTPGYVPGNWDRPRRSPALATILSMMPGLGQIYLGYYQQGFTNMAIFAGCITALSSNRLEGIEPFIAVGMAFFFMYNMIDANRRAHHLNRVAAGLSPEQFPDEFPLPKPRSSMFGGVIMIAIGMLIILDLNFDVPLDWIEDWWPLALVLIGVRMVWQAKRKAH